MEFKEFQTLLHPHRGQLVIDGFEIVLVLDVVEEPDDFYWVYVSLKRGLYYSSCVGGFIPLKGHIPDNDYNDLTRIWNLNCLPEHKIEVSNE